MSLAVKLDGQTFRRAVKIKNESANAVLPSKLATIKPAVFDHIPECSFGWCELASERTSEPFGLRKIVNVG
jgi:hypothetical protein